MERPYTTLFMLMSVDGKISTGDTDNLDVDQDYKNIAGLREGLHQYYDLEQETDLFSLNTGRVFAKIGVNEKRDDPEKTDVSYVVIDSQPHLTETGVSYLAKKSKQLFVVTTNRAHPAYEKHKDCGNIEIVSYDSEIDFVDLMQRLKKDFGIERLTIQSGGTLNTVLMRAGLVDRVRLVVAPALVGGKHTASLMDGESLHEAADLSSVKALKLIQARPLQDSYLLLDYEVKN